MIGTLWFPASRRPVVARCGIHVTWPVPDDPGTSVKLPVARSCCPVSSTKSTGTVCVTDSAPEFAASTRTFTGSPATGWTEADGSRGATIDYGQGGGCGSGCAATDSAQSAGEFAVTGLRTDPVPAGCWRASERPGRRREFWRAVSDANRPRALRGRYRPGACGDGHLHARPGSSGTGQVTWIPQRATSGLLEAGNQIVPSPWLMAHLAKPADGSDQVSPPENSPPDE